VFPIHVHVTPIELITIKKLFPDCGKPDNDISTVVQSTGVTVGHVAIYACAPGYNELEGIIQRFCEEEGEWSAEAPICSPIGIVYTGCD